MLRVTTGCGDLFYQTDLIHATPAKSGGSEVTSGHADLIYDIPAKSGGLEVTTGHADLIHGVPAKSGEWEVITGHADLILDFPAKTGGRRSTRASALPPTSCVNRQSQIKGSLILT